MGSKHQSVMSLYRQGPIKVSYDLARFVDHRHRGNRDVMILVCHVILQTTGRDSKGQRVM